MRLKTLLALAAITLWTAPLAFAQELPCEGDCGGDGGEGSYCNQPVYTDGLDFRNSPCTILGFNGTRIDTRTQQEKYVACYYGDGSLWKETYSYTYGTWTYGVCWPF